MPQLMMMVRHSCSLEKQRVALVGVRAALQLKLPAAPEVAAPQPVAQSAIHPAVGSLGRPGAALSHPGAAVVHPGAALAPPGAALAPPGAAQIVQPAVFALARLVGHLKPVTVRPAAASPISAEKMVRPR